MIGKMRRQPFLVAGVVIVVLLLIFLRQSNLIDHEYVKHLPGHDYIAKPLSSASPASEAANSPPEANDPPPEAANPPPAATSAPAPPYEEPPRPSGYIEDAHRLPNADAFRPHIDAVLSMPGMTLAEAKAGCTWNETEKVNFQFGKSVEWAQKDRPEHEIVSRRNKLHKFIKTGLVPWSQAEGRYEGRGIVTLGGNEEGKTFKRMIITLNALKRVGCELPIEVHYWGDEFSEENRELILKNYPTAFFHDLSSPDNAIKINKHMMPNFQFKIAALLNSRFAEPLLLDSDNLAVIDPAELYDSDTYNEYGSIFWPDIARTLPQNPIWPITNTRCRMDEYEQESGQLLVDKRRYWYHLQVALYFLNRDHERFFYGRIILGDKDAFRFAWHTLKTKYGYPARWLSSVGTLRKSDNWYCGHSFAQYHPDHFDGRAAFLHGGLLKSFNKKYVKHLHSSGEGIFQVYKSSPTPEDHGKNPTEIMIGIMTADGYVPDEDPGQKIAFCTQFLDIEARNLSELIIPDFEKTYQELQGYWILEDVE